ncbi:hypothetical protein MNB_SV-12-1623 [hydrothermal vent metagenome]|uniref:Trypsin n=1 Tax=hydrothermal vent metagenome TaxID=652676 RepID=A0A1W1CBA0_9ZZZZ
MLNINWRIALPFGFFTFLAFMTYLADIKKQNFIFSFLELIPYGDKVGHLLGMGVMALLLNYALRFKSYKFLGFNMQIGAIIVLTVVGIEELSQYWIPNRTCDIFDFIADMAGVTISSLIVGGKKHE